MEPQAELAGRDLQTAAKARAEHPAERLLEESWSKRTRRAGQRELAVESAAAVLFLAVALPLGLPELLAGRLNLDLVLLLVGLYGLVGGAIGFPIGAGYLVPTYAVLVPMLLLLPPASVPLLAAMGGVLAALVRLLTRRARPEHILYAVPNAWYSVGPAVVLMLTGERHGSLVMGAIYASAFLAGCLIDLLTSALREAGALLIAPQIQLRVTAQVWVIDACIAPLGLLLALAARDNYVALLMVLPLGALLLVLQRDRDQRIIQAQERLELATTDPLTRLGNRRKLTTDLARLLEAASTAKPLVLMVFDLDGFKAYNDTFGHMAGDALLARMGAKLAAVIASDGAAYRLGGDEFCVMLATRPDDLPAAVTSVSEALREDGETFSIAASGGAVLLPQEASTPEYALQLADERMYQRKQERLPSAAREQTRDVLVRIMQAKQPGLPDHTSEVSRLAVSVGRRLELDGDEWELVRQHTLIGERILSAAPALRPVARIVRSSHERWDGRGYPDGLAGKEIPLGARIVAVCDAYDAIVSDRCYRAARSPAFARDELIREAGYQFDPAVVAAALDVLDQIGPPSALRADLEHSSSR